MLTYITRYIAIVAVFMHSLLCGNAYCCAMTCSTKDDAVLISHDSHLHAPASSCPCHSEKHESGQENPGNEKSSGMDSNHQCDHQHHFCQCLHSAIPNNGTDFRVILNPNLFALPVVFLSAIDAITIPVLNLHTAETFGDSSAIGVRLHLLLEHFLI